VTRRYGDVLALDGVNLDIGENEVFGIIGPNGSGKTTLLSCLQGLEVPTAGSLSVLGLDPQRDREALNVRMGVQLQAAALLPRLRVGEALQLFSTFYPRHVPHEPLLEQLGIAAQRKVQISKLSGGERQRVFIALALLHDPELVFFDELTTAVDPQGRLAIWDVVRQVHARGRTVVLTTHSMQEAEELCDRVAILDHGRVIALDTVSALVRQNGGTASLRLTLSGPPPEQLFALPQVAAIHTDPEGIVVQGHGSFAADVLAVLYGSGREVREMSMSAPGLEDVFLELTGRPMRAEAA
jgi:ABC-2 type transport system ATP-binding protein